MSFSLARLRTLFEQKSFVINQLFTLEGKYHLVEIISLNSAVSILVSINAKYAIPSEGGKHEYTLVNKTAATHARILADELTLRGSYKEIDHLSQLLQSEEKLSEIYDKPISLQGEEEKSQDKFGGISRQLLRFKLSVRNIPFKFALADDDCLCLLNSNNDVECFFIESYRMKKKRIFVTVPLDVFFGATDPEADVIKILDQFHNMLQGNQKLETTKIQSMIDNKRNVAAQSRRIFDMKEKLIAQIVSSQRQHGVLVSKRRELDVKDPRLEMPKIDEQIKKVLAEVSNARKKLDEITLVVDEILFDSMLYLTRIQENFQAFDKLK